MNIIKPECTHGIINRNPQTPFTYFGWPSVCYDNNTLYAVSSGYRMRHVCPFGKTVMNISRDEGKSWSSPIIVNDTALDDRDAGIISLGNGRLLVTWFCHPAKLYRTKYRDSVLRDCTDEQRPLVEAGLTYMQKTCKDENYGGSFIRISEDNGLTWGETIKVPVTTPHGPILLKDNTLLYCGKVMEGAYEESTPITVYKSDLSAKEWTKLAEILPPEGVKNSDFHEPHIIELKNGRIFCGIRTHGEKAYRGSSVYTCYSDDQGKTWSVPKSNDIDGMPPHFCLHSSGALLMSVGKRGNKPFGEYVYASYDDGETWTDAYELRDDALSDDLGYPCTVELSDGSLLTVYYQKHEDDWNTSLMYTKWSLK